MAIKHIKIALILLVITSGTVQGWDFFGLFKSSEGTTTPSPVSSTTTSAPVTTTQKVTTTTTSNGACWWTQCGTRCAATAMVHDFNGVNCNPGQYKFRCCTN